PPDLFRALVAAAGGADGPRAIYKEIAVTLPSSGDTAVSAQVYRGHRGQPQHLEALRMDVRTGQVLERIVYEDQSRARRFRTFLRYAHTGEYWGTAGQSVAGIASLAAVALGITGIGLALRRLAAFRRRPRRGIDPFRVR
ncbi:MAG: PepSY domain-containing protein, partial [Gemmatimonadota bacterium]|nr:PepSY domain-containing protein [Gemmatimonadota bacterium]